MRCEGWVIRKRWAMEEEQQAVGKNVGCEKLLTSGLRNEGWILSRVNSKQSLVSRMFLKCSLFTNHHSPKILN